MSSVKEEKMLFRSLNRISETGFLRYSRSEKQNKSTLHFVFRSLNRISETGFLRYSRSEKQN